MKERYMKDLLDIRKDIDKIDEQIVKLYEERMKLTSDVAEYKINTGKQVFDKEREESKLATLQKKAESDFTRHGIRELFEPFLQGNAEFTNKYPIEKYWCTKPQKIANPTDILLSVRAPVGAINIANKKFCIGRGLSAISFNCNKLFGKYNLEFNLFQLIKKSQGSTFSSINKKDISEVILFIPCLEEQTKIADFLSAFDRKLENQKAQLEHWKQIKKGLLQQMFV